MCFRSALQYYLASHKQQILNDKINSPIELLSVPSYIKIVKIISLIQSKRHVFLIVLHVHE